MIGEKTMLYLEYPKCSTCKKAKKWLESNGILFEQRDIVKQNPTKEELKEWHQKSNLPLKRFFNTSGNVYKELGLKDKLKNMTEEEQYAILATNGMLVKRPILITDKIVLLGFKETEWQNSIL